MDNRIYGRKIKAEEQAIREARVRQADARFSGDDAGARRAASDIDASLDNLSGLLAMEKYRARD